MQHDVSELQTANDVVYPITALCKYEYVIQDPTTMQLPQCITTHLSSKQQIMCNQPRVCVVCDTRSLTMQLYTFEVQTANYV